MEKKKNTPTDVSILQAKFQKLLLDVCARFKMIFNKEEINDILQIFLASLPSGYADFIPQSSDLSEIVQALSENEMLDFWNYYLLQYIVDMFGKKDLHLASLMKQYITDRSDFQVTEIKHFTLTAKQSYVAGSHHTSVKRSRDGFVQVSMQVDECMANASLHYIDRVHEMLASRLLLHLHALLFHTAIKKDMHLVWYIPVTAVDRAKEVLQNTDLYLPEILSVVIDDMCVYQKKSEFQRVRVNAEEVVRIYLRFWIVNAT